MLGFSPIIQVFSLRNPCNLCHPRSASANATIHRSAQLQIGTLLNHISLLKATAFGLTFFRSHKVIVRTSRGHGAQTPVVLCG